MKRIAISAFLVIVAGCTPEVRHFDESTGASSTSGSGTGGGTSSSGGTCAPGTKQCKGDVPQTCNMDGEWQSSAPCAYVCAAGDCTGVCSPGATQCDGPVPQTCDAAGQWQSGKYCTTGCVGGACNPPVEWQVNATTADDQAIPAVAVLDDGSYVVTYVHTKPKSTIWARHFSAGDAPIGDELVVDASDDDVHAVVASRAGGGFAVAWTYWTFAAWGIGPYMRLFNSDSTPAGESFLVGATSHAFAFNENITRRSDGSLAVSWHDFEGGGVPYARFYDANGGAQTDIVGYGDGGQSYSEHVGAPIAGLDDGRTVALWGPGLPDVRARVFDSSGTPSGSSLLVTSSTIGERAVIAAMPNGGFIAAWNQSDASGSGIHAQRFDNTLATVGDPFAVTTTTADEPRVPSIAVNASTGAVVVAWTSQGQDGDQGTVVLRLFNSDGKAVTDEIVANTVTAGDQANPAVASFSDGSWLVVWQSGPGSGSNTQDGSGDGVFAQRFDATGARVP